MNISFENKRVLVTGASRGIGNAVAKAMVKGKAEKVFALAKTESLLQKLAAESPAGVVVPVPVNLCDWNATKEAVEKIGPLDIVVNDAGMFIGEPVGDIKPESCDIMFGVNVKAMINVSQTAAKEMIKKKAGCIINVSSQASMMALQDHTVYCASKAAVDSLTRVMALELGQHNIRVVTVNPTVVLTDMGRATWSEEKKSKPLLSRIPLRRFAEVEEIVNVILFLASDKASMVNGSSLPIDGGALAT